jgi:2-oxoisovalerate dehydrogenase E2 component (dihydrolipoyl transacylase)
MARYSFRLPDIGEGIAEAEIVAWHVAVGERIEEDQPIADLMTDKATVEMSSPVSGVVLSLSGAVGDQIAIGSTLAEFEVEDEAGAVAEATLAETCTVEQTQPAGAPEPVANEPGTAMPVPEEAREAAATAVQRTDKTVDGSPGPRVLASPAVRQRARDLGIELARVRPGAEGRIRHADLDAFLSYNRRDGFATGAPLRRDEQVRVIGLRRRIAENMAAAKRHIPHFTYVEEIDVTKLEALREDLNATRGERPKLTMLPLIILALCRAVPEFPMVNARYDDEAGVVTRHGGVHLGMATQTEAGLMVPVIRDAQSLNLWQLATEIRRLAEAARGGKASAGELSGSTITLTSLGTLGGIVSTPVINRPEVAIVGVNRVIERPVLVNGVVEGRKLMNLSSSFDHRVVDGWDAASFIQAVRRLLETPALLFVQ